MSSFVKCICEWCGKIFEKERREYNRKIRENTPFFCSLSCVGKHSNAKRYGKKIIETVSCGNCGEPVEIKYKPNGSGKKEKYFCSVSCANTRNHSEITKAKISSSVSKIWQEEPHRFENSIKATIENNNSRFTSAGEEEIRNYFIEKYPCDGWVFGGTLKYDDKLLSRDLYSNKLKVCVEYDGIWHFKDIHGQLEDKQQKDFVLKGWCEENEYRLFRVRERVYKNNKENLIDVLETLIYKNNSFKFCKIYEESDIFRLKENLVES